VDGDGDDDTGEEDDGDDEDDAGEEDDTGEEDDADTGLIYLQGSRKWS